jgi:hypothetical protein
MSESTSDLRTAVTGRRSNIEKMIDDAADIVAPVFVAQDWKYGGWFDEPSHVPSKDEIIEALQHLVNSLHDPRVRRCASGRFVVDKVYNDEGSAEPTGIGLLLELGSFRFLR